MPVEKRKAETSKFQKITQTLVAIFIVPVLIVSALSIYIFSSTKQNSLLPSGFGYTVITVNEAFDNFTAGQKIIVAATSVNQIVKDDLVAYYAASSEPTENGGSVIEFKKVEDIKTIDGKNYLGFASNGEQINYFQVEDAIIGVFKGDVAIFRMLLQFFSNQNAVIFVGLLPLFVLLIFLGLDILEQFSIRKMNNEIDMAILKAGSAGFDTSSIEEEVNNQKLSRPTVQTMAKPVSPSKVVPVAPKPTVATPVPPKAPFAPVPPKAPVKKPPLPPTPPVPPTPPLPPKAGPKPPMPPKR